MRKLVYVNLYLTTLKKFNTFKNRTVKIIDCTTTLNTELNYYHFKEEQFQSIDLFMQLTLLNFSILHRK